MEAIKQLGTNGGGFLNANSATTFENPTAITNSAAILRRNVFIYGVGGIITPFACIKVIDLILVALHWY